MKNKKKSSKNKLIFLMIIIFISVLTIIIFFNHSKENPENTYKEYIKLLNEKKYDQMYEMITKESKDNISKENFIKRNKNIYEGINANNIEIKIEEILKEKQYIKIKYLEKMQTNAGKIEFQNNINMKKEDKIYKINWTHSQIFPQLKENYKVKISNIKSTRGEIIDRNNVKIAKNGKILSVGIVPKKFEKDKENNISKISKLLDISKNFINSQLNLPYVKEDTFVPIKKISTENSKLKEELLTIPGIMITSIDGRVYPFGKEFAHLIGYIQNISQDTLKEKQKDGYNTNSLIGKSGLEQTLEDKLRGIDGKKIYIEDENGNNVKQLAILDKKDGENIKLTVDSNLQKRVYEQLKHDKGLFVIINPNTGEILSLVSTPTYDSNDFILGLSDSKWNELNNNISKPLFNRFQQIYCPGSTFKPITAGIALTQKVIDKNKTYDYNGLSWQKDSTWGKYNITTLKSYYGNKNVENALINSDNIFFARTALDIGKERFEKSLKDLGFYDKLDLPLDIKKSQYGNKEKIKNEIKLADTGYGQGDLLVNPIHMASIYSSFANEGKMINPYIIHDENKKISYYNENAFSKEAANIVKNSMIEVIENPNGTAKDMKIEGLKIAGKTGTAELKKSQEDKESGTLGWFNCFTINRNDQNFVIIGMVENTQDNNDGGSHYVINKIKNILK